MIDPVKTIHTTDLPKLLRRMRGQRTLEAFAKQHGITKQIVSRWESGKSHPRPQILKAMGVLIRYSAEID
jgi:DNA-binding transcriptional regulator YiaG